MLSYSERLAQSKEGREASQNIIKVREAQLQLMKDVLDAEKRKNNALSRLEVLKGTFPLNTAEILTAQYDFDAANDNLVSLVSLSEELFPENTVSENVSEERKAAPKKAAKPAARRK